MMKTWYVVVIAFLISYNIQATVVKRSLSAIGSCIKNKEKLIFNAFKEQIDIYSSKLDVQKSADLQKNSNDVQFDYDLQCSCFYLLLGEYMKNAQIGQYDTYIYDRALRALAKTPKETLEKAYDEIAAQIIYHDRPWNSNWAARHEFLRICPKL